MKRYLVIALIGSLGSLQAQVSEPMSLPEKLDTFKGEQVRPKNQIRIGMPCLSNSVTRKDLDPCRGFIFNWNHQLIKAEDLLFVSLGTNMISWNFVHQNHRAWTAAVSSVMQGYFFSDPSQHRYTPYMEVNVGLSYSSTKKMGKKNKATRAELQSMFGLGARIGEKYDVAFLVLHYCNAGVFRTNSGFTVPIFLVGYYL